LKKCLKLGRKVTEDRSVTSFSLLTHNLAILRIHIFTQFVEMSVGSSSGDSTHEKTQSERSADNTELWKWERDPLLSS